MKPALAFCMIGIFISIASIAFAQVIPSFMYDNQRTGRTEHNGPRETSLIWTFRTGSSISASPVLGNDGMIYLASTDGNVYALDSQGELQWTFSADDAIFGTPAIAPNGNIHFGTLNGTCYAVKPDGTEEWQLRGLSGSDARMIAAPVVDGDGQSYIGTWNDWFYAIAIDGTIRWQSRLSGLISSSPALDEENNVYIATLQNRGLIVEKYSPSSSNALWTFSENLNHNYNRIISSPSIDSTRRRLYVGANRRDDGIVVSVDIDRGRLIWQTDLAKGVFSTPAIGADGTVYVGCLDGNLHALDAETGSAQWTFNVDGMMIMGSASIDGNGIVYVGDTNGILYAISPAGEEVWRFQTKSNIQSAPVIAADGTLYLTSFDSALYAISEPAAVREWLRHR